MIRCTEQMFVAKSCTQSGKIRQRPQIRMNKELIDAKDVKSRIDGNWAKVVGAGLFLPASIKVGAIQ